ncbi:MAG TPA: hypothetical protein VGQ77_10325, partial [Methylomirabilota bacterium]|nr:hypothetical protein [Methylomirabilota bacterium]
MRVCTFEVGGVARAGAIGADGAILAIRDLVAGGPDEIIALIAEGATLWERVAGAAARARGGVPMESAELRAPIPRPARNVFCVGWNYSEHFEEGKSFRGQTSA